MWLTWAHASWPWLRVLASFLCLLRLEVLTLILFRRFASVEGCVCGGRCFLKRRPKVALLKMRRNWNIFDWGRGGSVGGCFSGEVNWCSEIWAIWEGRSWAWLITNVFCLMRKEISGQWLRWSRLLAFPCHGVLGLSTFQELLPSPTWNAYMIAENKLSQPCPTTSVLRGFHCGRTPEVLPTRECSWILRSCRCLNKVVGSRIQQQGLELARSWIWMTRCTASESEDKGATATLTR